MLTGVEAETSFAAAKPRLLFSVYLAGLPEFPQIAEGFESIPDLRGNWRQYSTVLKGG
jgi:hypothetical protein